MFRSSLKRKRDIEDCIDVVGDTENNGRPWNDPEFLEEMGVALLANDVYTSDEVSFINK